VPLTFLERDGSSLRVDRVQDTLVSDLSRRARRKGSDHRRFSFSVALSILDYARERGVKLTSDFEIRLITDPMN
jgi:hypothetical protein